MSRRTHKKSKNGCVECKRRHVKCDEGRPRCVNCSVAEIPCSFHDTPPHFPVSQAIPFATQSRDTPSAGATSSNDIDKGDHVHFVANMDHLEFFSQFCTETWKGFQAEEQDADTSFRAVYKFAFQAPYLMHEMLAIGALHLSVLRPHQRDTYRNYAAGLQTRALSLFNSTNLNIDATNCAPIFMFSSFLGIHVLYDTLAYQDDTILERFTQYLDLHRGVRTITSASWHLLLETELKVTIQAAANLPQTGERLGSECQGLKNLIKSSNLDPEATNAYLLVIQHLQWVFDAEYSIPRQSTGLIFAWPILTSPAYTCLLAQRRPEALIILAHFGGLLHRHCDLWIVGDGGRFLTETIIKHLGSHWSKWLTWPKAVLAGLLPA